MITNESFTKEWIESFRQQEEYRKIDPALLEKMIHALALVEKLAQHDFEFIFKGGTSLILLLKKPFRFSVDVDIITPVEKSELEKVLNEVIENSHFTSWSIGGIMEFHDLWNWDYLTCNNDLWKKGV